jgi:hypothetical protein
MVSRYPILASGLNDKDATGRVFEKHCTWDHRAFAARDAQKKRARRALKCGQTAEFLRSYRAESALAKNIVLIVVCWRGLDTVRFPSDFFNRKLHNNRPKF